MRRFLFLCFLLSVSFSLQAGTRDSLERVYAKKHPWRFELSVGYGFAAGKQTLGEYDEVLSSEEVINKKILGTLGTGWWGFGNAVYMARPHFGIVAGAYYFQGKNTTTYYYGDHKPGANMHIADKAAVVSTGPEAGFLFSDTLRHRLIITGQSALMFGVANKASLFHEISDERQNIRQEFDREEWKGLSIGWVNRAGIAWKWNSRWILGAEGFVVLHSWSPKKGRVVACTENGNDMMGTLPDSIKEYTLVNSISSSPGHPAPGNLALRSTYPLHSAGLLLHITYIL